MKQTRLSDLSKPQAKIFNCWTCIYKVDIIMQNGLQRVKCRAKSGVQPFPIGNCHIWSDGSDGWPEIPEGCEPDPKKWRLQR